MKDEGRFFLSNLTCKHGKHSVNVQSFHQNRFHFSEDKSRAHLYSLKETDGRRPKHLNAVLNIFYLIGKIFSDLTGTGISSAARREGITPQPSPQPTQARIMEIMGTLLRLSERAGLRWWLVSRSVYNDIEVNERKIRALVHANKNRLEIVFFLIFSLYFYMSFQIGHTYNFH